MSENSTYETDFELATVIIGVVSVELYFLSPIISIVKYKLGKCEINHIPFIQILCNLVNCASYIVSGINLNDKQQLICNLIGVIISAIFTVLLWTFFAQEQNSAEKKGKGQKTETVIYLFMLFNFVFQVFYFLKSQTEIIKALTCFWNVLMYAVGYVNVYEAYKAKKAEFVPWQGAICGMISTVMWIGYSSSRISRVSSDFLDYYPSLIGNSIGFLVLVGILCTYFVFRKKFDGFDVKKNGSLLSVSETKPNESSKTDSIQNNDDDYD